MEYYVVDVIINIHGDALVRIAIPKKFILPKYMKYYDPKNHKIANKIILEYFKNHESDRLKDIVKKEIKRKYGQDIDIIKVDLNKIYSQPHEIVIEGKAVFGNKPKREEPIIL